MNPALQKAIFTIVAAALGGAATLPQAAAFAPVLTAVAGALVGLAHGKRPGDTTPAELAAMKSALAKWETEQ